MAEKEAASFCQAIVVLAGDPPILAAKQLQELATMPNTLVVAADGGADTCTTLHILPQALIGDNDSRQLPIPTCTEQVTLPCRKDFTDGAAALSYAAERTCGQIWVFGAFGGRIDHQLNNLLMPLHALKDACRVTMVGDDFSASYCNHFCRICGKVGDTVSLLPLTAVRGLCLQGFAYPLVKYDATPGDSRTISNLLAEETGIIQLDSGWLLIVHYGTEPGTYGAKP